MIEMSNENTRNWRQYKLIITDPPAYSVHFDLIKNNIIPFINELGIRFWVTNYRNPSTDHITFRVDVDEEELDMTEKFLNKLKNENKIVDWAGKNWNPETDARARINSACKRIEESGSQLPQDFRNSFITEERIEQLKLLFENAVGPCAKILYETLNTRPDEPWMMSLFIHLLLNAIDISGPDPPTLESRIRWLPPL